MSTKRFHWRRILGVVSSLLVLLGLAAGYVVRRKLPPELMTDIRSGIPARNEKDPAKRLNIYLENRYGSQDDPANREKVFVDFFNPDHIEAMQLMVRHSPEAMRQESIDAMADWVSAYRDSLSDADRARLRERFGTDQGRAVLRQATAKYNQQDVQYRGQTANVISELLKTIHSLEHP
ncbi:MAG: hypothetical protein RI897_1095 [Verrucomicrobiota bacterium]